MKILFLSQYFPPEVGAPQNRLFLLAKKLQELGAEVTILTAMPNYPSMLIMKPYRRKLFCYEELDSLKIYRSFIYVKKTKILFLRLLTYFSFVFSSLAAGIIKIKKHDYLFCESPPLFLGITAIILSKIKKSKLIFNVSDLWPESAEKLGLVKNKAVLSVSKFLEETIYRQSFLITGQTQGIVTNIQKRFPAKKVYWLKNGVDINSLKKSEIANWRLSKGFSLQDFIVLYAGIIGFAQGLETVIKAAQILSNYDKIKFVLLGDGPEKSRMQKLSSQNNLTNIFFFDPEPKKNIPNILSSSSAAVIPLKKLDLFKGAIPSKIFETAACKKPILLGVEGEAKQLFIEQGNCGLSFFPEDANDLAEKILQLYNSPQLVQDLGNNGYNFVTQNFNLDKIVNDFWTLLK